MRKLRRSRTNRRIAGVIGGIGDYFGMDATVLRLGFIVISVLFLAVIGGPVIYVLACIAMPQEEANATPAPTAGPAAYPATGSRVQGAFGGRPWHDWDRTARSWVIVLGALVLASCWVFGAGPGIHWGALPFWLVLAAVVVWAMSRGRSANSWANPTATWQASPSGAAPSDPAGSAGPTGPSAGPTGPSGGPTVVGKRETAGAGGTPDPAGVTAPADPASQEATDWAQAQTAAAQWAQTQLAVAGIAASGTSAPLAPPVPQVLPPRSSGARRAVTVLLALCVGLLLLAVVGAGGVAIGSGSSLRGGFGNRTFAPSSLSSVQSAYHLGGGKLNVDLSEVKFPPGGRTVDITLGLGRLSLEVPTQAVVTIDAQAGFGRLVLFGQKQSGTQVQVTQEDSSPAGLGTSHRAAVPHLTIDAHVGIGEVIVTWG